MNIMAQRERGGDNMSEYEIGKEVSNIQSELEVMRGLLQQLYAIVEHNLKSKNLTEPPKEKGK